MLFTASAMLLCLLPRAAAEDAKEKVAKVTIRNFERAAKVYFLKNERFPQKLDDLTEGAMPYIEPRRDALLDPWGNKFHYDPAGKRNKGTKPDIWTETPDKKVIGNWPDAMK
jgi:hypothetical protein